MKYLNIYFPGRFRNRARVIPFILSKATAQEQQCYPRSGGLAAELEQRSAQSDTLWSPGPEDHQKTEASLTTICPEMLFVPLKALLTSSSGGHTVRNQNQVAHLKFLS